MQNKFFGTLTTALFLFSFFSFAPIAGAVQSPANCTADNSQVNISSNVSVAKPGDIITFTVSAGNPASVDGCDITNRTVTLTLPNGVIHNFGPTNYPNGTVVGVIGNAPYTANNANLSGGLWTAGITWDGTLKNVADLPSNGSKQASVIAVDARISIGTSGTNDINDDHIFTVTIEKKLGSTWSPADNVDVTESELGVGSITGGTCTTGNTDVNGQCTIIVNSTVPGQSTVDASATVSVGGLNVAVATNGYGANQISNVKTWVAGKIIVVKQTNPDGNQTVFDFDLSYGDLDADLSDGQSDDSGFLVPGTYSVTENILAGWNLTSAVCTNQSQGAEGTSGATGVTGISLGAGETITCTFTNTLQTGNIIVVKQTDPDGDTTSFEFNPSWPGNNFFLQDNGTPNDSGPLAPGVYSVGEILPSGWDLESSICSDGSPASAIDLSSNETVTCTFVNEKDAKIIVVKQTTPDGNQTVFDFTASYDVDGFTLSDNGQNDSGDLDPGTYSVAETAETGWTMSGATCSDGSPIGAVSLQAGETVTCTFNNTLQTGKIIVDKVTVPTGSSQSFSFTTGGAGYNGFSLNDAAAPNDQTLVAGTYSVVENDTIGWTKTSATCVSSLGNPEVPGSISLQAGETVTCTFTNTVIPLAVQGCSPGFWKNKAVKSNRYPAPYTKDSLFTDVGFENAFPGKTLHQVLSTGGGGLTALGRIITSAYLNAATIPDYPGTAQDVVNAFNAVYPGGDYNALKNQYEALQDPCPLN